MPPPRDVALKRDAERAEEDQQHLKRAANQKAAKKPRVASARVELGPEAPAWAGMVERCALALNRSIKNIHACYTDNASVALQLEALGSEAVAKILQLNQKAEDGGVLSENERAYVLDTIAEVLTTPELTGKNGARAALQAVKYLAGAGVQTKNASTAKGPTASRAPKPTPKSAPKKTRPAPTPQSAPKKTRPAPKAASKKTRLARTPASTTPSKRRRR